MLKCAILKEIFYQDSISGIEKIAYEKNKGRTKEGKQKKWTIILSIIFAILTIVLGIIYMA